MAFDAKGFAVTTPRVTDQKTDGEKILTKCLKSATCILSVYRSLILASADGLCTDLLPNYIN